jgi:hypothetical protein
MISSHLDFVLLAIIISEKTSGCWAHLNATTLPTPPAPMIRTFDMLYALMIESFELSTNVVIRI